jgi:hypothetical protein
MVFNLQKGIARIVSSAEPRIQYRSLFIKLEILSLPCEYIFSLMNFVLNNKEHFQRNSATRSVSTGNMNHLRRPIANLSYLQKSSYYSGIKIFKSAIYSQKSYE